LTSFLGSVLATIVVLVSTAPAGAHSLLLRSTPAANSVVSVSPPYIALRFNNRIERRLSRVQLVDERGRVAVAPITADEGTAESLRAVVPPLLPGAWRVEWQVFSVDGHVVSGSYGFRLAP
jgi:methionine-rich copper-binding protein CopC